MADGPGDRGRSGDPLGREPARSSSGRPYGLPVWMVTVVLVLAAIGTLSIVRTVLSLAVTVVELALFVGLVVALAYVVRRRRAG
jgi:hypothetical protein